MSHYGFSLSRVHFWLRTSRHLHRFHVSNEQLWGRINHRREETSDVSRAQFWVFRHLWTTRFLALGSLLLCSSMWLDRALVRQHPVDVQLFLAVPNLQRRIRRKFIRNLWKTFALRRRKSLWKNFEKGWSGGLKFDGRVQGDQCFCKSDTQIFLLRKPQNCVFLFYFQLCLSSFCFTINIKFSLRINKFQLFTKTLFSFAKWKKVQERKTF